MVATKRFEITEIISVESDSPRFMRVWGRIRIRCRVKRMRSPWVLELGYFQAKALLKEVDRLMNAFDYDQR